MRSCISIKESIMCGKVKVKPVTPIVALARLSADFAEVAAALARAEGKVTDNTRWGGCSISPEARAVRQATYRVKEMFTTLTDLVDEVADTAR